MILKNSWTSVVAGGLMALAMALPSQLQAASTETAPNRAQQVIARVNGQPIYAHQLAPLHEKGLGKRALGQLIDTELIFQAGKKLKIDDLDQQVAKLTTSFKTHYPEEVAGKGEAEIADLATRQIIIREYMNKNDLVKPQVSEEEVRAYYEKNKKHWATPEEIVRVRHILVQASAEATEEERQQARQKIEQARQALSEGKDFAEVAQEFSEDNAAAAGGDIGDQKRGYMPPEFDKVAFSIEPGRPSDIIQTKFGYHILEVIKHYPKGYIGPYEDFKDFFTKFLNNQLVQKKLSDHLRALRNNAEIEIYDSEENAPEKP